MRVIVTGGRGMLGSDICNAFRADGHAVTAVGTAEADIANYARVRQMVLELQPELIIHAAAMTDVDGCERDQDRAYKINAIGSQNIAASAREVGASLVYISTDFVFDGEKRTPYTEFDQTNPLGVYGSSKLAGELIARDLCPQTYIVRTSWLYGMNGRCFPKTILRLANSKPTFNVVADQIGCPTYVVDVASAITDIVKTPLYGTYHVANSGQASWHEFAEAILEQYNIRRVVVEPIPASSWPSPTTRPAYSVLRSYVRELHGKAPLRHWRSALAEFVEVSRASDSIL